MQEPIWPRLSLLPFTVIVGIWVVFLLSFGDEFGWLHWVSISIILLVLLMWVYIDTAMKSRIRQPRRQFLEPIGSAISTLDVDLLFREGKGTLGSSQAQFFVRALLRPTEVFARITEHVESYHRSVQIRTTYSVSIDANDASLGSDFIIPLHLSPRGLLQDGLRLHDGKGTRISSLDSSQVAMYSAAVLRQLIWNVGRPAYDEYVRDIEKEVWPFLRGLAQVDHEVVAETIAKLMSLSPDKRGSESLVLVSTLIRQLAQIHPICVFVSSETARTNNWPNLHRFTLERRLIPRIDQMVPLALRRQLWLYRFVDSVREALGVRLNRISYNLSTSTRTRSYHVEIEGPEGTYLAADELLEPLSGQFSRQGPVQQSTIRARVTPRLGQRRSHAYISHNTNRSPVLVVTKFYERAPGSFGTTTMSSLAAAAVVFLISTHQQAQVADATVADQPWLIPALLAVPLAVAALSGLDSSKMPRHPSLLSRGINLGTVALVLGTFVLASLNGDNFEISPSVWIALPLAGVSLVMISLITWILRLALEQYFVQAKAR